MTDVAALLPQGRAHRLDEDFLADLPYDPAVLLIDRDVVLTDDAVHATMRTDVPLPFTVAQRTHPTRHPAHVNGGTLVHLTGMMAFVHAYHLHGMRHREGWIGFGARIERANFQRLVRLGPPLVVSCTSVRARVGSQRAVVRYVFEMRQDGAVAYTSEQTGFYVNVDAGASIEGAAAPLSG